MPEKDFEILNGTVSSVVFNSEETGYCVLRLDTGSEGLVTVVGCIPCASPGEGLELEGSWTTHPAHGPQFKTERAVRRLPETAAALYEYIAFGGIKGVGPVTARLIVEKFGVAALEIIEEQPQRLTELRGINPKKAEEIGRAFRRRAGLRRLIEFLVGQGLGAYLAMRIYRTYGDDSLAAVRDNPYIIINEYIGAQFADADKLAMNLGFDADSPERIQAAVIFELSHNLNNGHSFIPRDKLQAATSSLLEADGGQVSEAIDALISQGDVIEDAIAGVRACYLASLYAAETEVTERLLQMACVKLADKTELKGFIERAQTRLGVFLADGQRSALEIAAERRVMVLTGGPGTGKTTTVKAILELYALLGLKTVLTAPTGRAAKRMSELCLDDAQTVHRLLGMGFNNEIGAPVFQKCADDPIDAEAVILDEASMVDITLMDALLDAMKPDCRLVLVGDADQLPSVGPGNVFADIIGSGIIETVRLTEIFRQEAESRIIQNAHRINKGEAPELSNTGDFFVLQRKSPGKAVETILELCSERLPKHMGIDTSQIQVLSPTRMYETGTISLNRRLQAALNPPAEGKNEKRFGEFLFREGDKIMQIRNNYDIMWKKGETAGSGIFNGDIGLLLQINNQERTFCVDFEGKIAVYGFDMLTELEPAYALTVHKSQGSEYRAVIISVLKGAPSLMTRSVLYTAVTRARELLIIVGDNDVLCHMAENDRVQRRYSGLKARLKDGQV